MPSQMNKSTYQVISLNLQVVQLIFLEELEKHAPTKKKIVRANQVPYDQTLEKGHYD